MGAAAKGLLRLGEYLGGKYANEVIVISKVIQEIVRKRCGRVAHRIPNGVPLPKMGTDLFSSAENKISPHFERLGVRPAGPYVLAVARFVPEKGLHDLVEAFGALLQGDVQLVIAGDADHETEYSRGLRAAAGREPRIVLAGYQTGEPLYQLYAHARLFVLPSYHEGLPIALLEAMSYGLSVLVSDIPANKEVELPADRYFRCGNVKDLGEKMASLLERQMTVQEREALRARIAADYDWRRIAGQTVAVYETALGGEAEK